MGHDGATGTATHLSNLHTTPIEILETEFPCRITRFDLVPDSAGAGQWRGGLGIAREYELLEDAAVIRRFNRPGFHPRGLPGAKPGAAPGSWYGSAPMPNLRPQLRCASTCAQGSASCCKAQAAAATAIQRRATRPRLPAM